MSPLTPAPKALADASAIVRLYGSLLMIAASAGFAGSGFFGSAFATSPFSGAGWTT